MDGNCVGGSECRASMAPSVHGRTFDFRVHGPSSRPVLTFFYFILFFSFFFFNLKLPIMPLSYFVIQFNIKTFE